MINKKILIVGGSSGLGIHLTNLYFKNKYNVTIISRNPNLKLDKKIKQIRCNFMRNITMESIYIYHRIEINLIT